MTNIIERPLIYILLIIPLSCTNRIEEKEKVDSYNRNKFFTLNYEEILKQPAIIKLSEIASDIEYVSLETNDECLLRTTSVYNFTDDYIFVDNVDHVLMFDRNGNFIRKIGKSGRGPGEIGIIRNLSVLEKGKSLVVQTNWARKLYYFNYEGEFLKSIAVEDISAIIAVSKDRFLLYYQCHSGNEEYMFAVINHAGDTLDFVPNHYRWEKKKRFSGLMAYTFRPFYKYKGGYSFKSMYNDTIYNLLGDVIRPEYLIDLGKYKLPQELRVGVLDVPFYAAFDEFHKLSKDFRFVSVFEASETLFLESHTYSEEYKYNMIFSRITGKGKTLIDDNGLPGGISNDIDGGVDFWPIGAVNDSTVYMQVFPYNLVGEENMKRIVGSSAISPESKSRFIDLVKNLLESDNPVIMMVNLKR